MKPPFAYYGGKTKLAPRIAALLPTHRCYVEPFAGSLAVLLAKRRAPHEVINDLDGHVVNFWRQLRDHPDDLERLCRLTPYSREEFITCADLDIDDDLERARRWWVRVTQAYGRLQRSGWSTGVSRSGSRAATTLAYTERFAAVAERLRTVAVEHKPAVEVIEVYDAPNAVIYADPPYLGTARRRDKGDSPAYPTDMDDEASHVELAAALNACRGTVILSGYASPLYDDLYASWSRIEFDVHVPSANSVGDGTARAVEVLWVNRPTVLQLELGDIDAQPLPRQGVLTPKTGTPR